MTVGERIEQERKKIGLTMEELGEKLGVGRSAINKWEKGKVERISRAHIITMSRLFKCDPAWLGGYKEEVEAFATPEEFEAHWNAIGGGKHPIELSDEEYTLVVNYRAASKEDKMAAMRILSYARKLEEAYESKKD